LTFISVVMCNLLLIFINRSFSSWIIVAFQHSNPALWLVLAATAILLAASVYVPLSVPYLLSVPRVQPILCRFLSSVWQQSDFWNQ